jgi:cytochrome b subunit of formate dehydrogenase
VDGIPAPPISLGVLAPPLILIATAMVVLALDLLPPRGSKEHVGSVALAGVVVALVVSVLRWGSAERGFAGMIALDDYALFIDVIICYAAALTLLLSLDYLRRTGAESGEYYGLVLFSASGMMLLASATDLIVVFLAIEVMSLSLYVLAGIFKAQRTSSEASMKYFLLGAFASSFLLYGIALIYGATGSTNFDRIAAAVAGQPRPTMFLLGLGLLLVGFGFKISAVPFHMWAPDVYEGAPTSVSAFIATGSKAAAFAALIRLLAGAFRGAQPDVSAILWLLAALSMTVGNLVALAQSNLKRMLAYSSVAHVGYMLLTKRGRGLVRDLLPVPKDAKDVVGTLRYNLGLAKEKPRYGRYSYIEKAEYWALIWGTGVMGLTGILMWFENTSMGFMTKLGWDISRTIHFYEAWLAMLAILVWHIYYMVVNPDVYPMNTAWITGVISEKEMMEEHPLELEAIKKSRAAASAPGPAAGAAGAKAAASSVPSRSVCDSGAPSDAEASPRRASEPRNDAESRRA